VANLPGMITFELSKSLGNKVDEVIPGIDSRYIDYLLDISHRGAWPITGPYSRRGRLAFCSDTFDLSTPLTRTAALVLASSVRDKGNEDNPRYYAAFCAYARSAIQRQECLELARATYYVALSQRVMWFDTTEWPATKFQIQTILVHVLQYCRISEAWSSADQHPLSKTEFSLVARQMERILSIFRDVCWSLFYSYPSGVAEVSTTLREITGISITVLSRGLNGVGEGENVHAALLECLEVCLRASFLQLRKDHATNNGEIRQRHLSNIASRIIELLGQVVTVMEIFPGVGDLIKQAFDIELYTDRHGALADIFQPLENGGFLRLPLLHYSNAEHTRYVFQAAVMCCYARLMSGLMNAEANLNGRRRSDLSHAIAICRLLRSHDLNNRAQGENNRRELRSLFWAGLIMRKLNYNSGEAHSK